MNVLEIMAAEKQRVINEIMNKQLGHPPSSDERKLFVVEHNLNEVNIFYQGEVISRLVIFAQADNWPDEFDDNILKT